MREYIKNPENQSRTLDSNPKASRQAPISDVLQAYMNGTLGKRSIQREKAEDEDLLQTKRSGQSPTNVVLQRYKGSIQQYVQEDELLQGKFDSTSTIGQEFVQREEKPNNTGLPDNLKTGIENLSGYNMDDVKVYYNSEKPIQLNALAYAQGTDIHVAPGQEKHLPHEVWHVVQQKQGRVQPTMQLQGINMNDNEKLEKEADVMGEKSIKRDSELIKTKGNITDHNTAKYIQRVTVVNVLDDAHQNWIQVNTLNDLNLILGAHGIVQFTENEIFRRLRPNGQVGVGNAMFIRDDGVTLDQYVQIRVGNLANGALTSFINQAVQNMSKTIHNNQTANPLMGGLAPVGLSENGHLLPRQQLLGYIRTELSNIIARAPIQNITVPGGNNYTLDAVAANNFIYTEGATLTQIVTALTKSTINSIGIWNRVRTMHHPLYCAELKIAGIPNRRVFAVKGTVLLSVVGNAIH